MTDAVRQVESERKYTVDAEALVPRFEGPSRPRSVELLDATYYDTADRRLAAGKVIARRRRGGHDAGWHVKLPQTGGDRLEHRWPDGEEPPAPLLDLVAVEAAELVPVARLRTERQPVELLDQAGGVLAEFVDDQVRSTDLLTGIRRRWREWEVELGPAAPADRQRREELLDVIEAELAAAGARRSTLPSKLVHATSPAAATVVVAALADLVAELDGAEAAAIADEDDAVHQARIRVRRLRSVLATHRRHFSGHRVRELRDLLRRLGTALGTPRDLEVRARRAAEFGTDAEAEWRHYRKAHADLVEELNSSWHQRLHRDLRDFVADPRPRKIRSGQTAEQVLLDDLADGCDTVLALAAAVDTSDDREAALHEVRKKARRVRYSAEMQLGTETRDLDAPLGDLAATAKRLQSVLGEHRDDLAFADYLDSVEQYGLAAQARRRAGEHLVDYPDALAAFASAGQVVRRRSDRVGSGSTDIL